MVDVAIDNRFNGAIIRLCEYRSHHRSLSSDGKATEAEVNTNSLKFANVLFTPGNRIKEMLSVVKFRKV